jgi:hypothetical protein
MQKNSEIGKIQKDVPILLDRFLRRFIKDLIQKSAEYSIELGKTGHCMNYKLSREHIKLAIERDPKF